MAYLGNSPSITSQRIVSQFVATSGQTIFTPTNGYQVDYVDVYINGTKLLNSNDYTATNGTTITLVEPAVADDIVEIISLTPGSINYSYTKTESDTKYVNLVNGLIPSNLLPSYVDDVIEAANQAALPQTGETEKIYITLDNNKVYRWSGSAYVEIVGGAGGIIDAGVASSAANDYLQINAVDGGAYPWQ